MTCTRQSTEVQMVPPVYLNGQIYSHAGISAKSHPDQTPIPYK